MASKTRIYTFSALNTETREMGTMFIAAENTDAAEAHRWHMHGDPSMPIECAGYVGPIRYSGWAEEARGFVSADTLEAEDRAANPEKYRMVPVRNALTGKIVMERADTPYTLSVASETYWSS